MVILLYNLDSFVSIQLENCIKTKMYRLHRKITIYGQFSIFTLSFHVEIRKMLCATPSSLEL